MHTTRKFFFLNLFIFFVFISFSYAGDREGTAVGVILHSVSVKNGWVDELDANFKPISTKSDALQWRVPIVYGSITKDSHLDFGTDLAGWLLLVAIGSENDSPAIPALKGGDRNFQYQYWSLLNARMAINLFEVGFLPVLAGGQADMGYMGIRTGAKGGTGYFEDGSFFSYGVNAGTALETGGQLFRAFFMYNWIFMDKDKKGNGWGVELEFFPFHSNDALNFVRLQAFMKSEELSYPKNAVDADNFKYSNSQIGVGLIFNILY